MAVSERAQYLIEEFEWTRPRHGGDVEVAAPILELSPTYLERVLARANKEGAGVRYKSRKRS